MRRFLLLAAIVFPLSPCFAQDISPGLWEIKLDARVSSMPNMAAGPLKLMQCLSPADAQDPSRVLGGMSNPGASGCTFGDKSYAGNTFTFTMQCPGYSMQSRGEISFTATSMDGTISAVANVGGQNVEMSNRVTARRVGGC